MLADKTGVSSGELWSTGGCCLMLCGTHSLMQGTRWKHTTKRNSSPAPPCLIFRDVTCASCVWSALSICSDLLFLFHFSESGWSCVWSEEVWFSHHPPESPHSSRHLTTLHAFLTPQQHESCPTMNMLSLTVLYYYDTLLLSCDSCTHLPLGGWVEREGIIKTEFDTCSNLCWTPHEHLKSSLPFMVQDCVHLCKQEFYFQYLPLFGSHLPKKQNF